MASFEKSSYTDYDKYRESRRKERNARHKRQIAYIKSLSRPCLFCGSEENLQWHHYNPVDKSREILKLNNASRKRIDEEVAKCWCLCYDCHSKLHRRMVDPLPSCYPI